ncbi:unnamed protein product [Caenorhabditis auriculariae]|uniref:Uncharacterized protein n=1 Tax=Caenorhabditis auriculariae TaxID=2777116 RepID=A0A8S1I0N8_9PELO|nr:unnamed protein product [Caenorhabditis auriculariae]
MVVSRNPALSTFIAVAQSSFFLSTRHVSPMLFMGLRSRKRPPWERWTLRNPSDKVYQEDNWEVKMVNACQKPAGELLEGFRQAFFEVILKTLMKTRESQLGADAGDLALAPRGTWLTPGSLIH